MLQVNRRVEKERKSGNGRGDYCLLELILQTGREREKERKEWRRGREEDKWKERKARRVTGEEEITWWKQPLVNHSQVGEGKPQSVEETEERQS